jgi:hypothetical protein
MTPAESNKALVRRFYEEIDKATSACWMNSSLKTTSITARPLSPAWRRGAEG